MRAGPLPYGQERNLGAVRGPPRYISSAITAAVSVTVAVSTAVDPRSADRERARARGFGKKPRARWAGDSAGKPAGSVREARWVKCGKPAGGQVRETRWNRRGLPA